MGKTVHVEKEGMNLKQMAEYLGVSYSTAFKLSHQPGFPCVVVGKRRITPKSLLLKWLEEQAQQATMEE